MKLIYDCNCEDTYYMSYNVISIIGFKLFDVDITLYIDEKNIIFCN